MSVIVVGAYTLDLYMFGERLPKPGETVNCTEYAEAHGGKGANQAIAARRLGAETALIARLGRDLIGQRALDLFQSEGLNTHYLTMEEGEKTGAGFIILDKSGIQIITTFAGASFKISMADIERAQPVLNTASVLLLQGEVDPQISLAAARLCSDQTRVILDPSPVEAFEGLPFSKEVDILTPNEQEAVALTDSRYASAEDVASATGVTTILLTRGERGVEVYQKGKTVFVSAPVTQVVDTTGAGDAFNGAVAAGLDRGLELVIAVRNACRYATLSVTQRFCIPSYPRLAEFPWNEHEEPANFQV